MTECTLKHCAFFGLSWAEVVWNSCLGRFAVGFICQCVAMVAHMMAKHAQQ